MKTQHKMEIELWSFIVSQQCGRWCVVSSLERCDAFSNDQEEPNGDSRENRSNE